MAIRIHGQNYQIQKRLALCNGKTSQVNLHAAKYQIQMATSTVYALAIFTVLCSLLSMANVTFGPPLANNGQIQTEQMGAGCEAALANLESLSERTVRLGDPG